VAGDSTHTGGLSAEAKCPEGAPEGQTVEIRRAKGRPTLTWVGKRPLDRIRAFPAQQVERFAAVQESPPGSGASWRDWPDASPKAGLLFHGDNKEVLAHLLANGFRGRVKLIYIDPPFDSGADYIRTVAFRGAKGTATLGGEGYSLGEQIQYSDIWANDNYLQFMYERLILLSQLLASDGTLYLHSDTNRSAPLRLLLDEVFGPQGFMNEIIWQRTTAHSDTVGRFGEIHDLLYAYRNGESAVWNPSFLPYSGEYVEAKYNLIEPGTGRKYRLDNLTAPGPRPNLEYEWRGVKPPRGRCWAVNREQMARYEREGRIILSRTGMPQYKRYLDEMKGVPVQDIWTDIPPVNPMAGEKLGYPTQKPEALLERIIKASSNPGDLVFDCFVGSGTTPAVAQRLGRRWVACDINKGAIQTTAKRLMTLMQLQLSAAEIGGAQQMLIEAPGTGGDPRAAQFSFAVYRVNDYDLAVQHNEAVLLACEHLGVARSRADSFFDGTRGKQLVKIIPFGHPLTPLDLEEVKSELGRRPEEEREVLAVCLGKELAADAWLEEWNRLRTRGDVPNRIEAIELRSDPKYGGFIDHVPASARVRASRETGKLRVQIEDFVSPTILARLKAQSGILTPQVKDWRAMVDSVMIDPEYDGSTFNIAVADVPARKSDLVAGDYELPVPKPGSRVGVKITDMLGEEVLVVLDA
jgi:DNA modification methylase